MRGTRAILALLAIVATNIAAPPPVGALPAAAAAMPAEYADLVALFTDWRRTMLPPAADGRSDYSPEAVTRLAAALKAYRARLAAIDPSGWPLAARNDHAIVEAEINGLDFNLRVLQPWARDPSFYANVFADWSDVPAHEGPNAHPDINLYAFKYPLDPADQRVLATLLGAVPANLQAAKANLAAGNARDLWKYGSRAFEDQSETLTRLGAGTLVMNTLDGRIKADMTGASPALLRAIAEAKAATDVFAAWVAAEAPRKTGATGVGKPAYNWYAKNVERLPWDWDAQVALLRRELDRSVAALRLEELRNRSLPPLRPTDDPAAFAAIVAERQARFSQFLADTGLMPDAPWARAAIASQAMDFAAPEKRDFFGQVTAHDPFPLMSHFVHWIELARMRQAPHASPIRQAPPLFSIYANRSEGFATAYEELVMQAGLYDDIPHGRELVWIMLANRAARGLASLYVQANEMNLDQAGRFHAEWTPRGWSDPESRLVGFEQLLYARQPGYGPSYVTGKLQLDHLLAAVSHADDVAGRPFDMRATMQRIMDAGIMPVALIESEVLAPDRP